MSRSLIRVALLAIVLVFMAPASAGEVVGLRQPYEDVFVAVRGVIPRGARVVGIEFYSNDATVFPVVSLIADALTERALPERGGILRSVENVSAESGPTSVTFEPYEAQTDEFVWAVIRFPALRALRSEGRGGGPGIGTRPTRMLESERSLFGMDGSLNEFSRGFDISLVFAQASSAKAGGGDAPSSDGELPSGTARPTALSFHVANPARVSAAIAFGLPRATHVRLDVYDIVGRRVRSIADRTLDAGMHSRQWDGRDGAGVAVVSGIYFVVLRAENETLRHKLTLIR